MFTAQDEGLARYLHHGADMGAAEGFRLGGDPTKGAPFVARAGIVILACGGNARGGWQLGYRALARGGITADVRSGRAAVARAASSSWLPFTGMYRWS
jgi:hypothetical protein